MSVWHIARAPEGAVFIGRGSQWGNPFSHLLNSTARWHVATRSEAISAHRRWLWDEIRAQRIRLEDLAALAGADLACYCKPKDCHGDTLERAAEWAVERLQKT